jgi:stage V sporulation protein G
VKITEIRITLRDDNKLKGFASITLDDSFVIRGLKIIEGASGPFIAMPSRKRKDGTFQDIAHPINMETRDITTKDSSGYRELLEGVRSASISVSGLVDDDGAGGAGADLFAVLDGRTTTHIIFGLDAASDDYHYECDAFCTSLEISAGTEDNVTYSATFEVTGAISEVVA